MPSVSTAVGCRIGAIRVAAVVCGALMGWSCGGASSGSSSGGVPNFESGESSSGSTLRGIGTSASLGGPAMAPFATGMHYALLVSMLIVLGAAALTVLAGDTGEQHRLRSEPIGRPDPRESQGAV